jgi:DNA-binding transcriptional regulator YhcF (GntR family)
VVHAVARKSGSLVLDRLRDRILVGRYFGRWSPGDRLPSVRDVARLEAVDRKTAAAAYHHLEQEGLVRVEPRSGVYLDQELRSVDGDPLSRLHARWLEQAMISAGELGLGARTVTRMVDSVARLERYAVPIVDADPEHAELLAAELKRRTGLKFVPDEPRSLRARLTGGAPVGFVVATPIAAPAITGLAGRPPVVQATLSSELLTHLIRAARTGPVQVMVASTGLARELRRALDHGFGPPGGRVDVLTGQPSPNRRGGQPRLILWPGAADIDPDAVSGGVDDLRSWSLLSATTVARVRQALVRCALRNLHRSSGA